MTFSKLKNYAERWLTPALLLAGAAVRVAVFAQNRPLFLDEANLARCICPTEGFGSFFAALPHEQFAPPLFLCLEKCAVALGGCNEFALRLLPLVAGCALLLLFDFVARRLAIGFWWRVFGLFSIAFSDFFIRYSTEVKQYASDAAVALALLALVFVFEKKRRQWLGWAVAGSAAIWFSMPSVFVLAGVGCFFFFFTSPQPLSDEAGLNFSSKESPSPSERGWGEVKNSPRNLLPLAAVVACWLFSFATNYFLILKTSLADSALHDSHTQFFFPLLPTSTDQFLQIRDLLDSLVYYTFGHTFLAKLAGWTGLLAGVFCLFSKRKIREICLFCLPVVACFFASALGKYSLMPRLILWLLPLVLLVQMIGFQWICEKISGWRFFQNRKIWAAAPLAILLLAAAGTRDGWRFFSEKLEVSDVRSAMQFVAKNFQAGDQIWVNHETVPAFIFYQNLHDRRADFSLFKNVKLAAWDDRLDDFLKNLPDSTRRVWSVHGHLMSEESRRRLDEERARAAAVRQVELFEKWANAAVFRVR